MGHGQSTGVKSTRHSPISYIVLRNKYIQAKIYYEKENVKSGSRLQT